VYIQAADVQGGIGRYVYPLEEGGTDQEKLSFWQTDDKVHGKFSFDLSLRSGFAVDALRAPAHPHAMVSNADANNWQLLINKNGKENTKQVTPESVVDAGLANDGANRTDVFSDLETQEQGGTTSANRLNQDLVIYWRLKPNLPGSVELVAHKEPGKRRGTFMLTVTPGIDLQPITEGRDWVFVLDRSGSMQGQYQTLMDATAQALKTLGSQDRFKIILFSNTVEELTNDWVTADQVSISKVSEALNRSQVAGGTNMYAGISAGLRGLDADRTASIVLVTDGVANLGKTEKKDFLDLMAKHDVRLFTAIMGNGANRPLLDSMTKVSGGFATSVSNSDDVMGVLISATEKVKYQALHDVELKIKGLKTTDIVPTQSTTVYRGQQMVMFGHYFGDDEAEVVLKAKISGEPKEFRTKFSFPKEATSNPEVERLWAYAQIQELKDRADYLGESAQDYRSAIVKTATEYGLVTDFTSMLVMSDEQFEANNIERKNLKRRTKENEAANKRNASPASNNQVDQQQPAFSGNRTSYSGSGGGGAFSPLSFLMFLPLGIAWLRKRNYLKSYFKH
jgi:Ca-activated chloride channel family protein